tara:strand:- start:1125 stop:1337 length:213 start_codon:yes stop_codon:yes gene_type:complete
MTALQLLRFERDQKLRETDHLMITDWPIPDSKKLEWKTYRQTLRDLPSTASPSLDEHGQLTGVTWPTKPE